MALLKLFLFVILITLAFAGTCSAVFYLLLRVRRVRAQRKTTGLL
jgi:hypothetical protein